MMSFSRSVLWSVSCAVLMGTLLGCNLILDNGEATCDDGITNGDESDRDCGGHCPACADEKACVSAEDCASRVCTAEACVPATCSDGIVNGSESDTDCGGSCVACLNEMACKEDADCVSGGCVSQKCAPVVSSFSNDLISLAHAVAMDGSNGHVVVGVTDDEDILDGYVRLRMVKYSAPGVVQWEKPLSLPVDSRVIPYAVAIDAAGDIVIGGEYDGTIDLGCEDVESSGVGLDAFVAKFSGSEGSEPECVWLRTFGEPGQDDSVTAIAVDDDRNIFLTGYFQSETINLSHDKAAIFERSNSTSTQDPPPGFPTADIVVGKYDSDGGLLWSVTGGSTVEGFGDFDAKHDDRGTGIAVTNSGDVIVTGRGGSGTDLCGWGSPLQNDLTFCGAFFAKLDGMGAAGSTSCKWQRMIVGEGPSEGVAVTVDQGDRVVLLAKYQGITNFGSAQDLPIFSSQAYNGAVVKYSPLGKVLWQTSFGLPEDLGGGVDVGVLQSGKIAIDEMSGEVVIAGTWGCDGDSSIPCPLWFEDANAPVLQLTNAGYLDTFVAKYNANGTLVYPTSETPRPGFGGSGDDPSSPFELTLGLGLSSLNGNIVLVGSFYGSIEFGSSDLSVPDSEGEIRSYVLSLGNVPPGP